MRARNVKPGFLKNEDLADIGPYAQLVFLGLWQMADKEGKLEDRPRRIKAEIFPYYEPKPSLETLLKHLHEKEFIIRYKVNRLKLIKIINFEKHQSPHHTERKSILPDPCDSPLDNGEFTVSSPLDNGEYPSDSLNHESGIMNHESSINTLSTVKPVDGTDIQKVAIAWNDLAPKALSRVNLPFVRNVNKLKRLKAITKSHSLEWWNNLFNLLQDRPFLLGINDRGWKATLDFVLERAEEIMDGKYSGTKAQGQTLERMAGPAEWLAGREAKRETER